MIESLPVLTVRYPALLPETTAFVAVAGPADAALARVARGDPQFALGVFVRQDGVASGLTGLMRIGCVAVVEEVVVERGQLLGLRLRGLARAELLGPFEEADAALLRARVRVLDAPAAVDPLLRAQLARVRTRLPNAGLTLDAPELAALMAVEEPGHFADLLAAQLDDLSLEARLALLTTLAPAARLVLVDRLLDARAPAPTSELGRVWARLREPCDAVPGHASLRARAMQIDVAALHDLRLRHMVEELARARPILVVEVDDSRELEARRESLSQLTSAMRSLTALRECGGPDDAALQAEIAASVAFLLAVASRERAEIDRAR
ncbi:MAG TPA: LON peptidase substrate-binding domain-containing protein [Nannocystis sp.]